MAKACNQTRHFKTGAETNPIDAFREIAKIRRDRFNRRRFEFSVGVGADFVRETLDAIGIPYFYVAENRDWHFEGLLGTERELRDKWIARALAPLYPDNLDGTRLAYSVAVGGVRRLLVDDSTNEILPKQLDFCREFWRVGSRPFFSPIFRFTRRAAASVSASIIPIGTPQTT